MSSMFSQTGSAITSALSNLGNSIIDVIPGIIAAIVILIVGYIVAMIFGAIVKTAIAKIEPLKKHMQEEHLLKVVGKFNLAEFFGISVKWYVFVLFLSPAAQFIKLASLSDFLSKVALWAPNLIIAIIIGLVGFFGAEYVQLKLRAMNSKVCAMLGDGARVVISLFVVIIALKQVGIGVSVAESSFLIVLGGIMLALGLAFGLGGQEQAKKILENLKKGL